MISKNYLIGKHNATNILSICRFPWIINTVIEPEDVADKVVEGLRRNYEHVYIPNFVQFAGTYAK